MPKVLVVEDNDSIRQLYERILMRYEITSVDDAEKAFKALEFDAFDLVILDMHLPTISGLEILKHIRQFPRHQQVPVFAISADDRMKFKAQSLGIQLWMTKPIELEDLILAVRQCVG